MIKENRRIWQKEEMKNSNKIHSSRINIICFGMAKNIAKDEHKTTKTEKVKERERERAGGRAVD